MPPSLNFPQLDFVKPLKWVSPLDLGARQFTSAGALCDRSTFTSTNARTTDLCHCVFAGLVVVLEGVVCAEQTEKNGQGQLHFPLEENTLPMPLVGVCVLQEPKLSPSPNLFMVSEPGIG